MASRQPQQVYREGLWRRNFPGRCVLLRHNNNNNNNNDDDDNDEDDDDDDDDDDDNNDDHNNNNNNNNLPPSINGDRCAALLRLVVFRSFLDLIQSANQNLPNWIITMQPQNVTMCIVSFPSFLLCLNMKSPNPKEICRIFMDVRNFEDLAPLVKE